MHKNHILASRRMHHLVSLSRFDIYYKQIYLKPPIKKPDFIKYKRSPKKWAKKWRKRVKTRTPDFGT